MSMEPDRDYSGEALNRLREAGIDFDPEFSSALGQFINRGIRRAQSEGRQGEYEPALEAFIQAMLQYATDTNIRFYNASVFRRIRDLFCPGFWPFC